MKAICSIFIVVLFFGACSSKVPNIKERKNLAQSLVENKNLVQKEINTSSFNLFSYQKVSKSCKNIRVYIEGDGLSWISRNIISQNPTPIEPIGLKLFLVDDSSCKVYLARPCQYTSSNICEEKYWTNERFSKKIIESFNEALNTTKKEFSPNSFEIVGYSGGAAIALLVSSSRDDIENITTIAGNLDIKKWVEIQNISNLNGSLNPADFSKSLEKIKQHHLIGENDRIIPKEIFFSYKSKFENQKNITYSLHKATHNCCWEEIYKEYLDD